MTSITPTVGPTTGGTPFVINGTNLSGVTSVQFNGVPATVLGSTAAQVFGTTPTGPLTGGPVIVTVITPAGSASLPLGAFTCYVTPPLPTGLAITPNSGSSLGGTAFAISGSNLNSVVAVLFNGVPATALTVTNTTINGTAPAGAVGPATVTLVTPYGTFSLPSGSFSFA